MRVKLGAVPAHPVELLRQGLERRRFARHRAHDVEGVDVARALPDRVERRLAVEPGQAVLLDVAVAAEALERLGDHRRGALAHPELAERDAEPGDVGLTAASNGVGEPQAEHGRRLRLEREVGQHVAHERLIDEEGSERATGAGVVDRLRRPRSRIVDAEPSTQSSRVAPTMSMIVAHAAALVAEPTPHVPSSSTSLDAFEGCRACP